MQHDTLQMLQHLTRTANLWQTTRIHSTTLLQTTSVRPYKTVRELNTSSSYRLAQPVSQFLSTTMITEPLPPPLVSRKRIKANRHALPASWMRCGTSKGLFIDRQYLPEQTEAWRPWLMAAMGSREGDLRQLDGIGGATSTTSKVAVVEPSTRPGIDVEYTFAQVAVGKEVIDYSGNCGNIASGVGPFALEQGMVSSRVGEKQIDISILNTNTNTVLVETIALDEYGCYEESGDYRMAGVAGTGSEVKVAFLNPMGTMTGKLFPTGNKEDTIVVPASSKTAAFRVRATLVDAGNPFVLVDASTLPVSLDKTMLSNPDTLPLQVLNSIRCEAAVIMGLASSAEQAELKPGTPKIAMILSPNEARILFPDKTKDNATPDVSVVSLSMGKLHPSLQLTGAVAISSALSVENTVPYRLSRRNIGTTPLIPRKSQVPSTVCIGHRSGNIKVTVNAHTTLSETHIESCSVSRTARTLFEGQVLFRS